MTNFFFKVVYACAFFSLALFSGARYTAYTATASLFVFVDFPRVFWMAFSTPASVLLLLTSWFHLFFRCVLRRRKYFLDGL